MPCKVTFGDGNSISYLYAADGTKLRTVHRIGETTTTTDYCGNVIYENGIRQRLLTEEGYVDLTADAPVYHYFHKDHLGNVRVVEKLTTDTGFNPVERNDYYAFGGLINDISASSVQPYKYNGKELDRTNGLNWYDYGARMYDPALGRFHVQDRFAEKYPSLSPYQYAANNPIRNIDVNGDSLVVLHHSEGTHMGMLIQNDAGKWSYYSVNGDNVYISGKFTGGKQTDDLGTMEFDSPQAFLESDYNSKEKSDNTNGYGYAEGYIIPTTPEQDEAMRNTFVDISVNEDYNLFTNNCATAVQRTMGAVGLETTFPIIFPIGKAIVNIPKNPVPNFAFDAITRNNPSGQKNYRKKEK